MFARDQRQVVADADLDVRTEVQPIDERRRFEVSAEIKLIRIDRDAAADAAVLRQRGVDENSTSPSKNDRPVNQRVTKCLMHSSSYMSRCKTPA